MPLGARAPLGGGSPQRQTTPNATLMTARKATMSAEIRQLIEALDRACRESRQIRQEAEDAMKRRVFWPERRHSFHARHSVDWRIPREEVSEESSDEAA